MVTWSLKKRKEEEHALVVLLKLNFPEDDLANIKCNLQAL